MSVFVKFQMSQHDMCRSYSNQDFFCCDTALVQHNNPQVREAAATTAEMKWKHKPQLCVCCGIISVNIAANWNCITLKPVHVRIPLESPSLSDLTVLLDRFSTLRSNYCTQAWVLPLWIKAPAKFINGNEHEDADFSLDYHYCLFLVQS